MKTMALWLYTTPLAYAATVDTRQWGGEGTNVSVDQIVGNVLSVGTSSIIYLSTAIFIVGALLFATSAGEEKRKSTGKDLMEGAVIGVAVVAGAKGIFKIVYMFIQYN